MSEDNGLNLRSRVVPRHLGNDQTSSAGHADNLLPTLPELFETSGRSAPQEPALSELFGQIARMLESVERIHASLEKSRQTQGARLDSMLAAVTASNENVARIG